MQKAKTLIDKAVGDEEPDEYWSSEANAYVKNIVDKIDLLQPYQQAATWVHPLSLVVQVRRHIRLAPIM